MEKIPWHSYRIKDTLEKLDTSPRGLSSFEVLVRLKKYGPNELEHVKKRNELLKFLDQFKNPLVYLLVFAAIVTYFLKHNIDTIIILLIVLFNASIGYFQERKAEKALDALKKLMALKTKVIRDNQKKEVSSFELVPGDIIVLEEGMKTPADIRILEAVHLKVDESVLTGEAIPVTKNIAPQKDNIQLVDRSNMLFAGTVIATGYGLGVVVNTGGQTELALIAKKVTSIKDDTTPLFEKLGKFSKYLFIITLWLSVLIFIVGILRGMDAVQMFLTGVATAVAIIPEGLPAVITITLAIGVSKMAKQNAITRRLSAVETLGSMTLIASDKTGTLTYNQMTLKNIFTNNLTYDVSGNGYKPIGSFYENKKKISPNNILPLGKLILVSALCNNATLIEEDDEWKIIGDPTEGALLVTASKAGLQDEALKKRYIKHDEIPFNSRYQYMATLNHDKNKSEDIIAVKGTVEKILSYSDYQYQNDKIVKLTEKDKEHILSEAKKSARKSFRILAFATKKAYGKSEKITHKDVRRLTFLGFASMEDPPRQDAIDAIEKCKYAGIKVAMITGDFPETAKAIAMQIGIGNANSNVLSGDEISRMPEKKLFDAVKNTTIYARVTPEIKLKIVETYKKMGNIIGVTGDGINDAPILKFADVGIAMGQGGTDVAREASDIVLVDNNFATIVKAIEEGRTIFQNIRRAIFFLLSTNAAEASVLLLSLMFGLPVPLTAIQILWINLITDGGSGFALAMEPKHEEVLSFKPRSPNEGILGKIVGTRIIIAAIVMTLGTLALYYYELKMGYSVAHAQTIAFTTITIFQIFNVLNSRSFKSSIFRSNPFSNRYVLGFFILMLILAVMTTQNTYFNNIFGTEPLSLNEWIKVLLVSSTIIIAIEIEKAVRRIIKSKY